MEYQAKLSAPFGVLGIRCTDELLTGIEFLVSGTELQVPRDSFAKAVCEQINAYLDDSGYQFDVPLKHADTLHQSKVRGAMCAIPTGQVQTYGELAAQIQSSPRAVGQACGANPIPIIIPCHRVVGKAGLGGFMHHGNGLPMDIKRWLLAHEQH